MKTGNRSDGAYAQADDTDLGNVEAVQDRVANMYRANSGFGNGGEQVETGPRAPINTDIGDSIHQAAYDFQGQGRHEMNTPMHPKTDVTPIPDVDYQKGVPRGKR